MIYLLYRFFSFSCNRKHHAYRELYDFAGPERARKNLRQSFALRNYGAKDFWKYAFFFILKFDTASKAIETML